MHIWEIYAYNLLIFTDRCVKGRINYVLKKILISSHTDTQICKFTAHAYINIMPAIWYFYTMRSEVGTTHNSLLQKRNTSSSPSTLTVSQSLTDAPQA